MIVMKKELKFSATNQSKSTCKHKSPQYKSTYLQYLAEQEIKHYSKNVLDKYSHSNLNPI